MLAGNEVMAPLLPDSTRSSERSLTAQVTEKAMHPTLAPRARAAAPIVVRLEELEDRTVPSLFGLLGGSGSSQAATGGLLGVLGSTVTSVVSLVDHVAISLDTHPSVPVVGPASVGVTVSPTSPQPVSADVSATPDSTAAPLNLGVGVG